MTSATITATAGDCYLDSCVLLEVAGVMASCVRRGQLTAQRAHSLAKEFEAFRQERLALVEPRGSDFLQARQWLEPRRELPLRSGNALHLALARRHRLTLVSGDPLLGRCAQDLGLPIQLIG